MIDKSFAGPALWRCEPCVGTWPGPELLELADTAWGFCPRYKISFESAVIALTWWSGPYLTVMALESQPEPAYAEPKTVDALVVTNEPPALMAERSSGSACELACTGTARPNSFGVYDIVVMVERDRLRVRAMMICWGSRTSSGRNNASLGYAPDPMQAENQSSPVLQVE